RPTSTPRLPECALKTTNQPILDLLRADDLPGGPSPSRYFAWLRQGDASVLEPVFIHNRQDVLSMAVLLARFETVLRSSDDLDPLDRFGRARFLEGRGFELEAIREYRWLWSESRRAERPMARGAIGLR